MVDTQNTDLLPVPGWIHNENLAIILAIVRHPNIHWALQVHLVPAPVAFSFHFKRLLIILCSLTEADFISLHVHVNLAYGSHFQPPHWKSYLGSSKDVKDAWTLVRKQKQLSWEEIWKTSLEPQNIMSLMGSVSHGPVPAECLQRVGKSQWGLGM